MGPTIQSSLKEDVDTAVGDTLFKQVAGNSMTPARRDDSVPKRSLLAGALADITGVPQSQSGHALNT